MIINIVAILNIFLIGHMVFTFAERKNKSFPLPLNIIYSFMLGVGITTLSYFLFLITFGRYNILYLYCETSFSIVGGFLIFRKIRKNHVSLFKPNYQVIIFSFLAFVVSIFLVIFCLYHPHGEGDSITIWNLRARFLFLGGANWRNAFTDLLKYSHTNYPPFLPLAISRFWYITGNDSLFFPMGIALFSTIASPFVLFFSLDFFSNKFKALTASLVLLGTSAFLTQGASQFADIPLSLILLLIFVLAKFYNFNNTRMIYIMGFLSALLAFTKNEGVLIFLIFSIVFLIKKTRKERIAYFFGALPVLLALLYFKLFLAPPDDIFAEQTTSMLLQKLTNFQRHKIIILFFGKNIFFFGDWKINPFIILIPFLFLQFKKTVSLNSFRIRGFLILLLILVFEYLVYQISPYDILWHLKFSFNRLLLQLWPSFLFLSFLG